MLQKRDLGVACARLCRNEEHRHMGERGESYRDKQDRQGTKAFILQLGEHRADAANDAGKETLASCLCFGHVTPRFME